MQDCLRTQSFCKEARRGRKETSGGPKEPQRSLRAAEAQAAKREEQQIEITRRNEASCILRRAVGKERWGPEGALKRGGLGPGRTAAMRYVVLRNPRTVDKMPATLWLQTLASEAARSNKALNVTTEQLRSFLAATG